ncbi:MAG TPA: hypothetical protein VJZ49_04540 [Syntrophales bacterium]|nr:hypothetical protein [Syntrophales bacterium]
MKRLSRNSLETGSRSRSYRCEKCSERFEHYGRPLPKGRRICGPCREANSYVLSPGQRIVIDDDGEV